MSADKKVPGDKSHAQLGQDSSASNQIQQAGGGTDDATTKHMTDEKTAQPGQDRPRARNQDVLPEILGKQLRAAYGELLNTPVPDVFTDLVQRLRRQESGGEAAKSQTPRREESEQ